VHHLSTTGPLEGGPGRQEETFMMTRMTHRQIYVRTVLNLYVQLPDTSPPARLRDRALADHFFDRQIPIDIVETALLLGSARRIFRCPRPSPIRSLAYFEPIVQELLAPPFLPDDARFWRFHIHSAGAMDQGPEYDGKPPF
jgi:hypothetical protein